LMLLRASVEVGRRTAKAVCNVLRYKRRSAACCGTDCQRSFAPDIHGLAPHIFAPLFSFT
jgi:hypothetical protein